jgi:hypothetical protein
MPRRPLNGARNVNGDTASHAKYGVGPATDYGADSGESVFAPISGWVTHWWSDTGGWSVAVTSEDWKVTLQHNSGYRGPNSGWVKEGTLIALVGNTGSATTGPHVHMWIQRAKTGANRASFEGWLRDFMGWKNTARNGGRVPGPYSYSLAGGKTTPIVPTLKVEEDMQPTNYADKSTLTKGAFAVGTKCITVWPSGAIQHYEITSQPRADQVVYIMFDLYGEHKPIEKQVFNSIVAAHAALTSGANTAVGGSNVATNFQPVLDAVTAIPAATVKLMPKTGTINLS